MHAVCVHLDPGNYVKLRKNAGKAFKFAFVKIPQGIVGWQLNKQMFGHLRNNWVRATSPACPQCDRGVMVCDDAEEPTVIEQPGVPRQKAEHLYPWHCNECDFSILAKQDAGALRKTVAHLRSEQAQVAFSDMEMAERNAIARRHRIGARIFFAVALLTFLNFAQMMAFGVSWLVTINWLAFSLMFAVFGMKKSYRAWQVISGHLFEEGAFLHWVKHEKWLT